MKSTAPLLSILIIAFVFTLGCIQTELRTPSPQGTIKIEQMQTSQTPSQTPQKIQQEDRQKEIELIQNLNKAYETYHNIDFSKIDCNNPAHYDIDLVSLSLKNWVHNIQGETYQTAQWYPSLGEGQIGYLLFDLNNVGCTKVKPIYGSVVTFNDEVIFSSSGNEIPAVWNDLYPGDKIFWGKLPISGSYWKTVKVKSKGIYVVWIYIINQNTNNLVGVDKITLSMG